MAYGAAKEVFASILEKIKLDGLYKEERLICDPQGAELRVRFPAGAKEKNIINLCSNNYLGLSSHPEVIKAAHEGLEQRGYGMSSVRFICGTQDIHRQLEQELSSFLGVEDTCLFASCFDANAALFEAILSKEDAVISDKLIHASLIDGIRLFKGHKYIYEHSDMLDLEAKLKEAQHARLRLIVTDGVFSMDGDMARLDEIVNLANKYNSMVVVDDSHATGFIGKNGRGVHEHYNVMDKVDIITTTFGKALGGATGGCVAGKKEIVNMLKQKGRPYLFSNALAPMVTYATLKVMHLVQKADRREKLLSLTEYWRKALTNAGFDLKAGDTPIIPVMLYNAKLAQDFSRDLYEEGVFAVGFFYPVVPLGEARIRTQISAALETEHLDKALAAFVKIGKKYGILGLKRDALVEKFGL